MTEVNSVNFVERHVGVAHQVAMTSQLKRIRKCMLTMADRTCTGALGYLERLTDNVPRWARSGMLRWPACRPCHQQQQHEGCSVFSLPSCRTRTAHAVNGIEPGNLGS